MPVLSDSQYIFQHCCHCDRYMLC